MRSGRQCGTCVRGFQLSLLFADGRPYASLRRLGVCSPQYCEEPTRGSALLGTLSRVNRTTPKIPMFCAIASQLTSSSGVFATASGSQGYLEIEGADAKVKTALAGAPLSELVELFFEEEP